MFLNETNKVNDTRGIMRFLEDPMLSYDIILDLNLADSLNDAF